MNINNNNNIVGGNRGNNIITISYHTISRQQINHVMEEGVLDRYLIGEGIIPYNFNYNDNVYIRNAMIIDHSENRFIYDNRNIEETLINAVVNSLPNNNNYFHIVSFKRIQINADNLDEVGILVSNMIEAL